MQQCDNEKIDLPPKNFDQKDRGMSATTGSKTTPSRGSMTDSMNIGALPRDNLGSILCSGD